MYYIQNEQDKILLFDTDKQRLENTLQFRPDLLEEVEKEVEVEVSDFELVDGEEIPIMVEETYTITEPQYDENGNFIEEIEVEKTRQVPKTHTETKTIVAKVYPEIKETEEGYTIVDYEIVTLEQAKQEAERVERERISKLSLTKREVFLALYKDKGITPEQIRSTITSPEALIEFDYANDYYRGNPLIDELGTQLGYSAEQLDYLFEFGRFEKSEEVEMK